MTDTTVATEKTADVASNNSQTDAEAKKPTAKANAKAKKMLSNPDGFRKINTNNAVE